MVPPGVAQRMSDARSRLAAQFRGPRIRGETNRALLALFLLLCAVAVMTAAQVWGDRQFVLRVLGPRLVPDGVSAAFISGGSIPLMSAAAMAGAETTLVSDHVVGVGAATHTGHTATQTGHPATQTGHSDKGGQGAMEDALRELRAAFTGYGPYAIEPLYDPVIEMLPDLSVLRAWLPDLLLLTHVAACVVLTLALPGRALGLSSRIAIVRRFLLVQAGLYAMRTALILCTTVPSPVPACVPPVAADLGEQLVLMARMARGVLTGCTDNIYSAHTALATNAGLFAFAHCGRWPQRVLHAVHWLALVTVILATRLHYTVDVLLAALVTVLVFGAYHLLVAVAVFADGPAPTKEQRRMLAHVPSWVAATFAWLDGVDLRVTPPECEAPAATSERNEYSLRSKSVDPEDCSVA